MAFVICNLKKLLGIYSPSINNKHLKKEGELIMERTRIITAEITIIENINKEEKPVNEIIAEELKSKLGVDDVVVTNVQDFIMED